MIVTFSKLGPNGDDVPAGAITFDGRGFILNPPDSPLLKNVLNRRVVVPHGGPVGAFTNPVAWMAGLHHHYKSAYLRASAPAG